MSQPRLYFVPTDGVDSLNVFMTLTKVPGLGCGLWVTELPDIEQGDVILFAGIKDKKFHHVAMVGAKHKGTEWLDYAETIWSHQELPLRALKSRESVSVLLLYTPLRRMNWDQKPILQEVGMEGDVVERATGAGAVNGTAANAVLHRALTELYKGHPGAGDILAGAPKAPAPAPVVIPAPDTHTDAESAPEAPDSARNSGDSHPEAAGSGDSGPASGAATASLRTPDLTGGDSPTRSVRSTDKAGTGLVGEHGTAVKAEQDAPPAEPSAAPAVAPAPAPSPTISLGPSTAAAPPQHPQHGHVQHSQPAHAPQAPAPSDSARRRDARPAGTASPSSLPARLRFKADGYASGSSPRMGPCDSHGPCVSSQSFSFGCWAASPSISLRTGGQLPSPVSLTPTSNLRDAAPCWDPDRGVFVPVMLPAAVAAAMTACPCDAACPSLIPDVLSGASTTASPVITHDMGGPEGLDGPDGDALPPLSLSPGEALRAGTQTLSRSPTPSLADAAPAPGPLDPAASQACPTSASAPGSPALAPATAPEGFLSDSPFCLAPASPERPRPDPSRVPLMDRQAGPAAAGGGGSGSLSGSGKPVPDPVPMCSPRSASLGLVPRKRALPPSTCREGSLGLGDGAKRQKAAE